MGVTETRKAERNRDPGWDGLVGERRKKRQEAGKRMERNRGKGVQGKGKESKAKGT